MLRLVATAVLLTLSYPLNGYAKDVAKSSGQPQTTSNQQTQNSEKHPFFIKEIPAPHAEQRADKEENIEEKNSRNDEVLVGATIILAFFTLGLWRATYCLAKDARRIADEQAVDMKESLAIAKESSDAANATAKALIASERAYIFFEIGSNDPLQASHTPLKNELTVKIWNVGKTPAETIEIESYSIFLGYTPQDTSTNTVGIAKVPQGYGISTNNCMFHTVDCYLSNSDLTEIREGRMNLFVVCRITYRDILGKEYTTSNCWFYKPDTRGQRWLLAPDCKLNYRT